MALLIDKPAPSSVTMRAVYWRIASYAFDCGAKAVDIIMHGYWSADDRKAGAKPAATASLHLQCDADPTREWIYEQAKAHPDFTGAADA